MKHKLLCLTVCMLLAPITMLAQITGVLSGKVTDDKGEPVIGATIRIMGTTRGGFSKAPDGKFTIAGIRAGDYEVTVTAVGYQAVTKKVRISVDQTTEMNVKLSTQTIQGKTITVTEDRLIVPEKTGTIRKIQAEELQNTARVSMIDAVALENSASTTGQNGISIRGGRATETSIRIDGVSVGDPFIGGFGSTSARLYPTVSNLAIQEVQVIASSFDAQYGDVLAGVVNSVTKSGRNDRYEGTFKFRAPLPALYGKSDPLTVTKAGSTEDTTLPAAKQEGSGRQLYEFSFGGPIPGWNKMTFYLTGKYEPYTYTGAGYEVFDMSDAFANARAGIAKQLWGFALKPTNLGHLPQQQAMVRDLNAKFRVFLTDEIYLELGGEVGLTSRERGGWSDIYKFDHPVFFRDSSGGVANYDTVTSLVEGAMQAGDENTIINRINGRYFQNLDEASFIEVTGSYVYNKFQLGKKDESKSYGILDIYDIPDPVDADTNIAIDTYYLPETTISVNPYNTEPFSSFARNSLTGLYEGPESPGASKNPFGLTDLNFPVHGNSDPIEIRESTTLSFAGNYETNLDLGNVKTQIKAGFDFETFTLRRHSNQNPWDQNPFFDIYGYSSTYFTSKDTTGRLASFLESPYHPWRGGLYVSTRFDYKSIVFSPGVRFDFTNPNTQAPPTHRRTAREVLQSLDSVGDASMKFQVSPRLGVSYPVTESSQFRVNFGMMFKMPDFTQLYDNAYGDAQRGNQLFGNPDIAPQKAFIYEMGYETQIADNYYVDVSAFYRDIFNQTGVTYVPAVPSPYVIYTVQEYGNVRGLELSASGRIVDNLDARINYTLQKAVGTASSPTANYSVLIGQPDPYTGEQRTVPLVEFPLAYDQTHKLNGTLSLHYGDDQGPSIGGIKLLQNLSASFTATFGSGLPYTRTDTKGNQIGEYNGERYPSQFNTEMHIERGFYLRDLVGESMGDLQISFFVDVFNVLNNTGPVSYYTTTGSPDQNGTSLDQGVGEFTATPYYRTIDPSRPETFSNQQYDRYGERLYSPYADLNLDGVVTQAEKYEGYQRIVATIQSFRNNYQAPRTISLGFKLSF